MTAGVMEERAAKVEQLRLESWFPDAQDAIVRPDLVLPVSLYFFQRWAPRIGADAVLVLLWIRAEFARRGSRDPSARFVELPPQRELAAAVGLGGEKSLRAALRRLEAVGFLHRETRFRFDRALGRTVRDPDRFMIALADPVAPEDESALIDMQAARQAQLAAQCSIFPSDECVVGQEDLSTSESEPAQRADSLDAREGSEPAQRAGTVWITGSEPAQRADSLGVPAQRAVSLRRAPDNALRDSGSEPAQRAGTTLDSNGTDNLDSESLRTQKHDRRELASDAERQRSLAEDLVASLGDSGSRSFFRLVAARLDEIDVRVALAEALEARRSGRIRKSSAAYFTRLIQRRAHELGISLAARHARGAA